MPKVNPNRPPARWWAKMSHGVAKSYFGKKVKSLSRAESARAGRVVGGIWANFSDATKEMIMRKYEPTAASNPVKLIIPERIEDPEDFLADHDLKGAWISDFVSGKSSTKIVIEDLDDEREFAEYMRGFGYKARIVKNPRRNSKMPGKSYQSLWTVAIIGGLIYWLYKVNKGSGA